MQVLPNNAPHIVLLRLMPDFPQGGGKPKIIEVVETIIGWQVDAVECIDGKKAEVMPISVYAMRAMKTSSFADVDGAIVVHDQHTGLVYTDDRILRLDELRAEMQALFDKEA
jgi:hypothetical protein